MTTTSTADCLKTAAGKQKCMKLGVHKSGQRGVPERLGRDKRKTVRRYRDMQRISCGNGMVLKMPFCQKQRI